jgi:hypothetical protein
MRSPTCLLENRAYSPENFLNGGAKDFCNTIGIQRTSLAIHQVEDLSVGVNAMAKRTSKKPAKIAKNAAVKRRAAKPTRM